MTALKLGITRDKARRTGRRNAIEWAATVVLLVILLVAVIGPQVRPHNPDALIGVPFTPPGHGFLLGTDALGRDVLSRILAGGRDLVVLAFLATLVAYVVGGSAGLLAGYSRTFADPLIMRVMDVILAFPPILFLLVVATGASYSQIALAASIAIVQIPGVARIMRTATLEVSIRGYVEAAAARGESLARILFREILPNVRSIVVADAGPRFTVSILLVAAVSFLGLGQRPPAANWAMMISENSDGLSLNAYSVLAPAIVIALLTISLNVVADGSLRRRRAGRHGG